MQFFGLDFTEFAMQTESLSYEIDERNITQCTYPQFKYSFELFFASYFVKIKVLNSEVPQKFFQKLLKMYCTVIVFNINTLPFVGNKCTKICVFFCKSFSY